MENSDFDLINYNYTIPDSLIAQDPVLTRDRCRLLVFDRKNNSIQEGSFRDILNFLNEGDVLVLNDTKVIKARLMAEREKGGKIEVLLLKDMGEGVWEVLVKPGKRARVGEKLVFQGRDFTAKILDRTEQGNRILRFSPPDLKKALDSLGKVPLPPYIKKEIDDFQDYQTVYAKKEGAVAAPTAGLHFTPRLIKELEGKGVIVVHITLHCGLATFRPVKTDDIRQHKIESEWIEVGSQAARTVNTAKAQGRRVVAVGTTSMRTLESVCISDKKIKSFYGETNLYIVPGYKFNIVDAIITNFHTPCSTNLILVASFCGLKMLKRSYDYAVDKKFRFYSFGDAMMII